MFSYLLLDKGCAGCEIDKIPPRVLLPTVIRLDSPLGLGQRKILQGYLPWGAGRAEATCEVTRLWPGLHSVN